MKHDIDGEHRGTPQGTKCQRVTESRRTVGPVVLSAIRQAQVQHRLAKEAHGLTLPDGMRFTNGRMLPVELVRRVVVFDAADLGAESAFWAGMLDGRVLRDDRWHSVVDAEGRWVIGVQLAPGHVPPDWPNGSPQQVHLDLHVDDPASAHVKALALGARLLQEADDLAAAEGHEVFADPAGHPFCIGWGHPDDEAVRRYVRDHA